MGKEEYLQQGQNHQGPTGRFMVMDGAEDPEVKEKQRHLFGIPQLQPGGARSQF